jgi:hypothetical protein
MERFVPIALGSGAELSDRRAALGILKNKEHAELDVNVEGIFEDRVGALHEAQKSPAA